MPFLTLAGVGVPTSELRASVVIGRGSAVIEMVRKGSLPRNGLLKQECIPFDAFLATPTGRLFDE